MYMKSYVPICTYIHTYIQGVAMLYRVFKAMAELLYYVTQILWQQFCK